MVPTVVVWYAEVGCCGVVVVVVWRNGVCCGGVCPVQGEGGGNWLISRLGKSKGFYPPAGRFPPLTVEGGAGPALLVSEDNRRACPRREAIVRALHRLPHDVEVRLLTSFLSD